MNPALNAIISLIGCIGYTAIIYIISIIIYIIKKKDYPTSNDFLGISAVVLCIVITTMLAFSIFNEF